MPATQCPECGGAKTVHKAKYDRTQIPAHEHVHSGSDGDTWLRAQAITAGVNAVTCRVCWGRGTL